MFRLGIRQVARQQFKSIVRKNHGHHAPKELPPWALEPAFPKGGDPAAAKAFKSQLVATEHHAQSTSGLWKKITFFIAFPAIFVTAVNTYFVEKKHAEHREHLSHVPDSEWPPQYDYMNIRSKNFFWGDGDKTLFWNPVINRHIKSD